MNYWLMKSEPDVFSIQDLERKKVAPWDGVRNYRARNFMRAMRSGDPIFFYHSSTKPSAIVGIMTLVKEAHPDPSQFDKTSAQYDPGSLPDKPRWDQVEVRFQKHLKNPLTLEAIRGIPALSNMMLIHNSRLSVQPVTPDEWKEVLKRSA